MFQRYMRVVKGCFGDDPQIFRRQAQGVPAYSDTYWSGQLQNAELHRDRIAEVIEHGARTWSARGVHARRVLSSMYCEESSPRLSTVSSCFVFFNDGGEVVNC